MTGARQRRRAGGSRQMSGWAPYRPGEELVLRHACVDEDGDPLVHEALLPVRRVEAVHGVEPSWPYRWRVVLTRCDGLPVAVDVDHRGWSQSSSVRPKEPIGSMKEEGDDATVVVGSAERG